MNSKSSPQVGFRAILAKERSGWTPLHHAVHKCDITNVGDLLSAGGNINAEDTIGRTALHVAAQTIGSGPVAELLIDHGAQVSASGLLRKNVTPLHVAALSGNTDVVALLLRKGANVNAADNHRLTSLHNAAAEGHAESVDLLAGKGGDLNARDEDGATPLYFAAKSGHPSVAERLIDGGANVEIRDNQGNTPLTMSVHEGHAPLVALLIKAGADVNARGQAMRTPLFWTTTPEIAKLLIEKGADVNARNQWRNCPLHVASEKGNAPFADLLLASGAAADAENNKGRTPLHWAGNRQTAESLIGRGAKVGKTDIEGKTPCDLAEAEGRKEVAKALRERTPKRRWWQFSA